MGYNEFWLVRNTVLWLVRNYDRVNNLASILTINYYNQFTWCVSPCSIMPTLLHLCTTQLLLPGLHHHHHHGPSECHHHHHLANVLMRPAARLCWLNSGIKTNFLQQMQQFNFPSSDLLNKQLLPLLLIIYCPLTILFCCWNFYQSELFWYLHNLVYCSKISRIHQQINLRCCLLVV